MRRDDVLGAVSRAFGARAIAAVGFWNVQLETNPPREVIFTADWVARHVDAGSTSADELEQQLRNTSDKDWWTDQKTGLLVYVVR